MDETSLPVKRVLRPYFAPTLEGSKASTSEKTTVKKQKLSTASLTTSEDKNGDQKDKKAEQKQPQQQQQQQQSATKFFRIFDTTTKKKQLRPVSPSTTELQGDLPSPTNKPISPRSDSPAEATPFTITKSLNNIRVSDPANIPTIRKASIWTKPSRSSPRPLTPMKLRSGNENEDEDSGDDAAYHDDSGDSNANKKHHDGYDDVCGTDGDGDESYQSMMEMMMMTTIPTSKKQRSRAPWPDSDIFLGGHIKQSEKMSIDAENQSFNQLYPHRAPTCQPQRLVRTNGASYLISLRQKQRNSLKARQSDQQESPTMLSHLRISSPRLSTNNSLDSTQHLDEIEAAMDALYPPDVGGWRYPACEGLLEEMRSRPAADQGISWCEKYRPQQVQHLLDNQTHHCYVRDWLERQKVAPSKHSAASFFAPKKTKASQSAQWKQRYLDEDDNAPMDYHYNNGGNDDDDDDDDDFLPVGSKKKKTKATKKRNKKDLNMVLLVGPHGVGKTAGVYTAAQETGYQVFEIHTGTKRSYKEVMRLVGDMTRNHLVRFRANGGLCEQKETHHVNRLRSPPSSSSSSSDDGDEADDNTVANRDINQATNIGEKSTTEAISPLLPTATTKPNQLLTQFFTSKRNTSDTTASTPPMSLTSSTASTPSTVSTAHLKERSSSVLRTDTGPKQSMILLEEVDLLYQHDKGFWNAVADLAKSSKRPIVMTCNETMTVPFDMLQLQAVLYYEQPLQQLLLPYLHLICLMEGYTISTDELTYLLNTIGPDIRQLLTTLEFMHYQPEPWRSLHKGKHRRRLHNFMLQTHVNLLKELVALASSTAPSWLCISDRIPGAQVTPLCSQYLWNDVEGESDMIHDGDDHIEDDHIEDDHIDDDHIDNDDDDDDDSLSTLETWLNNRSTIDYGVAMSEERFSQVYGIDEYDANNDQQSGYLHFRKKTNAYDHWDMETFLESSLLELNQLQEGSALVDTMSWELMNDQRNKQKQKEMDFVPASLTCRDSMALGGITLMDIQYANKIEMDRRKASRRKRRRFR